MAEMTYHDIVRKLIGPISPVGETRADDRRFENLKEMCDLVDALLTDIDEVARMKDRHECSIRRAGNHASEFFDRIGIKE